MIAASSYKLACLQPVDNATGMKTVHSQATRSSLPLPKKHISSEYVRNAAAKRVACPTSASMAGRAPASFACSGARPRLPLPAPAEQTVCALVLFVILRRSALFRSVTQLTKNENAQESHSLLLFGAEGLIERLPRIGELVKVIRSLV